MSQTKWDEKASTYVRFSPDQEPFQQEVFRLLKAWGVDFTCKRVLDIGCGTGVYTLHIAKEAAHVDALDFSKEMLNILEKDAKSNGIHNITPFHDRFDTFTCKETYALAFCSMSPAVATPEMFEKMQHCAKEKVFLGWGGKRKSSLHDAIFEAFGTTYKPPRGGVELVEWLSSQAIVFTCKVLKERRVSVQNIEKSIQNVAWHLGINGVAYEEEALRALVEKAADAEGRVENVIESEMVLVRF